MLEGLISADSTIDRGKVKELFSKLGKRVFLLHNVHDKGSPKLFGTRFAMNYLAGPMTRAQIPDLNRLVGAGKTDVQAVPSASAQVPTQPPVRTPVTSKSITGTNDLTSTHPALPAEIAEYYLPNELGIKEAVDAAQLSLTGAPTAEGIVYRPALLAQAEVRYLNRRYSLDFVRLVTALVDQKLTGLIRWEEFVVSGVNSSSLQSQPLPQAKFAQIPGWLTDSRQLKDLEKDYQEWIYRTSDIKLRANEALRVYGSPDQSQAEFREMCSNAARDAMKTDQAKLDSVYKKKIADLEKKIDRQKMEVDEQKGELNSRRLEEAARGGEVLLSLLGGRKKSLSSSITKRRMTSKAKSDYEQEVNDLEILEKDYADLGKEYQTALKDLEDTWAEKANDVTEVPLAAAQKDIHLDLFGIAWRPYYLVKVGDASQEVPAFKQS